MIAKFVGPGGKHRTNFAIEGKHLNRTAVSKLRHDAGLNPT
jgi:hypothetical protein